MAETKFDRIFNFIAVLILIVLGIFFIASGFYFQDFLGGGIIIGAVILAPNLYIFYRGFIKKQSYF